MLNLDTHILLNALIGDVSKKEKRLLDSNPWSISAIVQCEVAKLIQLKKVEMDISLADLQQVFDGVHVWPISWEIAKRSTQLDYRSDPADEIIGATSLVHSIPLLTRDEKILRSKIVPFPK